MSRVLLVGVDGELTEALARGALAKEMLSVRSEAEAFEHVSRRAADLCAVVLGPLCSAPIQIAQRAYAADPDLGVLVLSTEQSCNELAEAIQFAPLLGDGVRCVPSLPAALLAGELQGVAARTGARRAHRRTIAALNERMTLPAAAPPRTRAEEYFGQIVDHAPIGIVVLDARRRVVGWNREAEALSGRSERAMLGASILPLFAADDALRLDAFLARAPDARAPLRDTFGMTGGAGPIDVEITRSDITGTSGGAGTLLLLDDVTLREQARRERETALDHVGFLAQASRLLGASLDLAVTLEMLSELAVPRLGDVCIVDLTEPDGWLDRVAVAHADPSKRALSARMRRRYPPLSRGTELGVAEVLARGEHVLYAEVSDAQLVRAARDDDHLAMLREMAMKSFLCVPMLSRGRVVGVITFGLAAGARTYGELHVALARDLADRAASAVANARLYAAAQEARQRAEEASRAKDEFLAVVSHELRTPLTAILGWSRVLTGRAGVPDQILRGLASIERNAAAQARIVEDILDTSRIVTGKLRLELARVDLAAIARLAFEIAAPTAQAKGVAVRISAPSPALVLGDADRLQQALWNLLGNAIKFTPSGGRVDLCVGGGERTVDVVVRDTGSGISADFLPYVFERFRQADASSSRTHGGLGLGLAIVKHIVELHGGSVRAESDGLGRGATFTITLPRLRDDPPREDVPPKAVGAPLARLDGTRVLLVEDDADTRELLVAALHERGAEVTAVGSAADAMTTLGLAPPDVLVSDLAMPGEDGHALLRRVRALPGVAGRIPALALSAYTGSADRERALAAGFQVYMTKPAQIDLLVRAIAELARGARG